VTQQLQNRKAHTLTMSKRRRCGLWFIEDQRRRSKTHCPMQHGYPPGMHCFRRDSKHALGIYDL